MTLAVDQEKEALQLSFPFLKGSEPQNPETAGLEVLVLASPRDKEIQSTDNFFGSDVSLRIYPLEHLAFLSGGDEQRLVHLTPIESKLLYYLMTNSGRVVSNREIFHHVWEEKLILGSDLGNIKYHIKNLRRKIGDGARDPKYIETVKGVGYKFIAEVSKLTSESVKAGY